MIQWIVVLSWGLPSFLARKTQWKQIFLEQMKGGEQGRIITYMKFIQINLTHSKATMAPGNLLWEWYM
jgi:hypothetical protein